MVLLRFSLPAVALILLSFAAPYVLGDGEEGYGNNKKYMIDNPDNPPGVASSDGNDLINGFVQGNALTSQQIALLAEKLGGIVVYIFSYLFMAGVFLSYIFGVVVLMIFKIMFGAFIPVASIELGTQNAYNLSMSSTAAPVQPPSSSAAPLPGSSSASPVYNSYGSIDNSYQQQQRYKREAAMYETDYFGRQARALMPYAAGMDNENQLDYMDNDLGLFGRTKAFLNRGFATGMFMYDILKQPECQKYIMCSTSSTFREERSQNVRFRDMLRQLTPVVNRVARSVDDLTQSVNIGAMSGRCHHPTMNCPALQPAVHKMNELLKYMGVKVN